MAKKDKDRKDDDNDVPASSVVTVLERLARLIRQTGHADGLTPVHWEALRFVARANRLSNSPGALTRYLGMTKGTVSQSIAMLEKKGLLQKSARVSDERSIALSLTEAGQTLLLKDPLTALVADIDNLGGKTRRRMARGLTDLLRQEVLRQQQPLFGSCATCRYYREGGPDKKDHCMLDKYELDSIEAAKLCAEFTAR